MATKYIRWFEELGLDDLPLVGGKNASLGELYRKLMPLGVPVPNGFAVTVQAYRDMLASTGIADKLHDLLDGLDKSDVTALGACGAAARELVYGTGFPQALREEILAAYQELAGEAPLPISVAVRSSATAEDLPSASFAGQHDTFLNVSGPEILLEACRRCFASLFTDRAISYRIDQGFDHFKVALSVGVMEMVQVDSAASGVMFTLDTETGFPDVVLINGAYGLGETVVQGSVDPDEFYVHKPTHKKGYRAVLRRKLGSKEIKMVAASGRTREATRILPTLPADRARFCISDGDVLTLAGYAIEIEKHYSEHAGRPMPMDIEWAKDGRSGTLYVVQARPETVASQKPPQILRHYVLGEHREPVVMGRAVGAKIAQGHVRLVADTRHLTEFCPGEVLVAETTAPDWEPVMKTAAAIVTNSGGRTCHAAIVARELGIPAVVGAVDATERLKDAETVTVSCAEGETGQVYAGEIPFEVRETDLSALERPVTKVMVNLGNPELAFKTSFLPNGGVGLARMEFIISESIRIHPMALLHLEKVTDPEERAEIEKLIRGYESPVDYFIERLSEGVGTIAAAFYPKPVIARMSDFKTNEYSALLGGRFFEPVEANPMIGFRGASRYIHEAYKDGFALECAAMQRVRIAMGLTNLRLMIPFCRTIPEAHKALEVMAEHGLKRGAKGLEIYVMCEIPNNVLQVDAFAGLFDGFSIGSNDLTQLVLGVDRDSEIVSFDFDERDPGVLAMIRLAVEGAKRCGRHMGICGQAPSDYPEIARYLVGLGIDSISLNPDSVLQTTLEILKAEQESSRLKLAGKA
jgi:pyruvate,water dikinase